MTESLISAWSFSRLKDYESCPYKLWLKVGEKRDQSHMDMTAADRGTMVHDSAEHYVDGTGDFIKEMSRFRPYFEELKSKYEAGDVILEENWGFTVDWEQTGWWDKNVWCRMKLDNLITDEYNPSGDPVVVTPTDYKTGKKYGNEVSHNMQGQLYAVGTFLRFPTVEVANVEIQYLDHGLTTKGIYTREKAMKFLPMWNTRAKRMTEAEDFPPKPTKVTCMWCPFGPQHGDGSCEWGV